MSIKNDTREGVLVSVLILSKLSLHIYLVRVASVGNEHSV